MRVALSSTPMADNAANGNEPLPNKPPFFTPAADLPVMDANGMCSSPSKIAAAAKKPNNPSKCSAHRQPT